MTIAAAVFGEFKTESGGCRRAKKTPTYNIRPTPTILLIIIIVQ